MNQIDEFQALERRLESARALVRRLCGPHGYQRTIIAAVHALDGVLVAEMESEGYEAEAIIEEALERAEDAVRDVEILCDATWQARFSPSVN